MIENNALADYCRLEDIGFTRQLTDAEKIEINRLHRIIYG